MRLVNFNFTKISIEKKKDTFKNLKISANIDVQDVQEVKQDIIKSNDDFLVVKFKYSINYSPDVALIDLQGRVLISADSKMAKEALKNWKDKKITEEFKIPLFNVIFRKAGLKALELEEEMGLPTHIQLPVLKGNKETKQ